jgi:hypothetical protein
VKANADARNERYKRRLLGLILGKSREKILIVAFGGEKQGESL